MLKAVFFSFILFCMGALYIRLRPVKLNMPICSVMWSHVPGVPRAWSLAFSWALINNTLSAMVFTLSFLGSNKTDERNYTSNNTFVFVFMSCSSCTVVCQFNVCIHHSMKSSGELRVRATRRAPWDGGLDQVVLTIFSIWDRTRFRLSASRATMVRLPTRSSEGTNKSYIKQYCSHGIIYIIGGDSDITDASL